jgi:Secretion system C-terminal sorting domain
MKKITLLIVLLSTFLSNAQYTKSALWIQDLESKKTGPFTIDELKSEFDKYWNTHDKDQKGSGFKPFMRWENHWKDLANPQGYIITPEEMWTAFNQKNSRKLNRSASAFSLPASNWQPVGPFTITGTGSWSTGQGRVNVVYEDPTNPNTLYIGTPAGGIWKSITGGSNWTALSDNLPQIGVSGIAVDPNNTNVIYISTGDCDGNDSYSIGVLKSIDGGLSWNTTGLTFTDTQSSSGDIIINPTDSNMIWVATSSGIYKSIDAGLIFTNVRTGDFSQGRLRVKPNDPTTLYAVSKNRFWKSNNSGSTFTVTTVGMPTSSGRLLMDVTAADANIVYILSSKTDATFQGVYKSIDSGVTFAKTASTTNVFESNQSGYDLGFAVSQTNANELYTGCLNIWRSLNGGTSFTKRNFWDNPSSSKYTHADIHYLRFFGNNFYCGSDGGVFKSTTAGTLTNFTNLTATAQIGQFYKIAVSKQSASKMVGGLQDNGGHAYSNNTWKNYYGADGMDTAVDPNNSNKFYGFIQFGTSMHITNNAGSSSAGAVGSPGGIEGNWVTPLVTNSIGEVYSGFTELFKISNGQWVQQNINSFGAGNIDLIMIDPSNNNTIYVVINNQLFKSINKGLNFNLLYEANNIIRSIEVHSTINSILYITTIGTNGQVLKSINNGLSFLDISQGLPNIGKNIIVHQGRNSINPLYLGTSLGVYYRDDSMSQWEPFDTNLPNVSVTDLDINLEDKKITAATYGRGIWQSNIVLELPSYDIKINEIISPSIANNECTEGTNPKIILKNDGLNTINNITVNYSFNSIVNSYSWSGVLLANENVTINLPEIILDNGNYQFSVEAITPNDSELTNNILTNNVAINKAGVYGQVNTFENQSDSLMTSDAFGIESSWKKGICTTGVLNTGVNNVYTTNFDNNYENGKKSFLNTGCYDFTQVINPVMKFKMAFDLQENSDILYVQYSIDSGLKWYKLGSKNPTWYNSDRNAIASQNDCYNCIGGQWTGTNTMLIEYVNPLGEFVSFNNVQFRIVFHSDDAINAKGVVIDDFVVEGTSILSTDKFELNKVAIYPNPSTDIFNVSLGNINPESIEVYDVSGKTIFSQKEFQNNGNIIPLNLTNASNGIYFVKIATEDQTITKTIIKK